ncbi:DUF4259 domain-containing protein [Pendulispora albinea]|uniref:DUF4259 domain-containing protein n=1 Tax=Pendulispora albinea TaxID=2741071 RepID=A0ABZ2M8B8_9BACT
MGAWGHQPFQNDTALDWADWVLETGVATAIQQTLQHVASANYLDADDGSTVVAAAAIVAAACDGDVAGLPDDIVPIVPHWNPGADIVQLARDGLSAVSGAQSELASLWGESSEDALWRATLEGLQGRLRHDRVSPTARHRP